MATQVDARLVYSLGAILVTAKRLAELRFLGRKSIEYRPTFKYYSNSLTVLHLFYVAVMLVTFVFLSLEHERQMLYFLPLILIFCLVCAFDFSAIEHC